MRKIEFYRTDSGRSPVYEFLMRLPTRVFRKVIWVLDLIRSWPRIPIEYLKKLEGTDDIWEIRVSFGRHAVRLLGFWDNGNLIILTNGFEKKSSQTPRSEIALAIQRKSEYKRRNAK